MILGFGNNIKGNIASDISANETVIPVMPGLGALFASTLVPDSTLANTSLSPTFFAKLTLTDEQETIFEICHLISVSGDNLTVIRGQEGTTARTWYINDHIANFATRGSENKFIQIEELQNGKYTASVASGTANDLVIDIPTSFFENSQDTVNLRTSLYIIPTHTNTGQATLSLAMSGNVIGTYALTKGNNQPLKSGDIVNGLPILVVLDTSISVFQVINPALGLLDEAEADKFFLRIDRKLSEIKTAGTAAQKSSRENLDIYDGSLTKKGLVQLTNLSDAADETSDLLALTPSGLKKKTDAIAPLVVPVGGAMLWFGAAAPDGWLEGNGQAFDKVANPKLSVIFPSGRVPDCRGYFLRALDNGAGVDPDSARLPGSIQNDAMQNIQGSFPSFDRWRAPGFYAGPFYSEGGQRWDSNVKSGGGDDWGSMVKFDLSMSARTATETRGKNIAMMVIFKTDKTEANAGTAGPSSIIITPLNATVKAGGTQQFSASVLPANSGSHPVTWSVSDAALGQISTTGLYTAVAGKSGVQVIIATIDTGLHATASVTQNIWAEQIAIAAIPDAVEGDSGKSVITLTPATADEPLEYSSSDRSIATFDNGNFYAVSKGKVTLTVKGHLSGVTATTDLTVTAAPAETTEMPFTLTLLLDNKEQPIVGTQNCKRVDFGPLRVVLFQISMTFPETATSPFWELRFPREVFGTPPSALSLPSNDALIYWHEDGSEKICAMTINQGGALSGFKLIDDATPDTLLSAQDLSKKVITFSYTHMELKGVTNLP